MPLGNNSGNKVENLIINCARNGKWLLLENLHLVIDWIPTFQKFLTAMYKEDALKRAAGASISIDDKE